MVSTGVMIITPIFAWQEKLEDELERLNSEYFNENEEVIDFQEIRRQEIAELKKELDLVNETLAAQLQTNASIEESIGKEKEIIRKQEEAQRKNWDAPPVDNSKLRTILLEQKEINEKITQTKNEKTKLEEKIKTKTLLLEIQEHGAKLVGIELSESCIELVKLNSTSCPSYEDLYSLDTSNQETSGGFSFHDGYFHREPSRYVNSWKYYYTEDEIRVIVDPHHELKQRIKMIVLENNLGYYALVSDIQTVNSTATIHRDRFIDNCDIATITAAKYLELIPDTIFTFRNGCQETNFDEKISYTLPTSPINLTESPSYHYFEWLDESMKKCKVLC